MLYRTVAHVIVSAQNDLDVIDGLNELFRGASQDFLVDWTFAGGGACVQPLEHLSVDDYEEGEAFDSGPQ